MISDFHKLDIWRRSRAHVKSIYILTSKFPDSEKYGLISQMRRASVSVPSNIEEGAGRRYVKEFKQFLQIAIASLCEMETQLYLANDLGLIEEKDIQPLLVKTTEIRRMIAGFSKSIKSSQ
jgi:four helix bundle protein